MFGSESMSGWFDSDKSRKPSREQNLLPDWEQGLSPAGKVYYFNRKTQESLWDPPLADNFEFGAPAPYPQREGGGNGQREAWADGSGEGHAWDGEQQDNYFNGRFDSWEDSRGGYGRPKGGWNGGGRDRSGQDGKGADHKGGGMVSDSGRGLGDGDLPSARILQSQDPKEINYAVNRISDAGVNWLLRPNWHFNSLTTLKLYKNFIGDGAAACLAEICRNCYNLREMHLSHNSLTVYGCRKLIPAACDLQYREKLLWLRLEQNDVQRPERLIDEWISRGLSLCTLRQGCTRTYCKHQKILHLPYFQTQKGSNEGAWCGDCDSGWWPGKGGYGREFSERTQGGNRSGEGEGRKGSSRDPKGETKTHSEGKTRSYGVKARSEGTMRSQSRPDTLDHSGQKLCDDDLAKKFESISAAGEQSASAKVLNLAINNLVGDNFDALRDLCLALENLEILKLYKNKIGDAGATYIAEICRLCPCLRELHLSHNEITNQGAEEIVTAACEPRGQDSDIPPLWLRLEYNKIEDPQNLFDEWKNKNLAVSVHRKGEPRHDLPKGVHLPFFLNQGKPANYLHGSTEKDEAPEEKQKSGGKQMKWRIKALAIEKGAEAADDEHAEADADHVKKVKKEKKIKKDRLRGAGEAEDGEERTVFDDGDDEDDEEEDGEE